MSSVTTLHRLVALALQLAHRLFVDREPVGGSTARLQTRFSQRDDALDALGAVRDRRRSRGR